jgi:putative tryptophan/tyrosine transport system substrate-binding protein
MAWAPDLVQKFRETAHFVEKILKGAKPGDLPVKDPAQYYLTVNKAVAKKIGLVIPDHILTQADKVL